MVWLPIKYPLEIKGWGCLQRLPFSLQQWAAPIQYIKYKSHNMTKCETNQNRITLSINKNNKLVRQQWATN